MKLHYVILIKQNVRYILHLGRKGVMLWLDRKLTMGK